MNIKQLLEFAGVDITKGKAKKLLEGYDAKVLQASADIYKEYRQILTKHFKNPNLERFKERFQQGQLMISAGVEKGDDNKMYQGLAEMRYAVRMMKIFIGENI